jgi:hypothetical protein
LGERVDRRPDALHREAGRVRGCAARSRNGETEVHVTPGEMDRYMSQITDVLVNTSTKLNLTAELDLVLGRKLDRLTDKVDLLADKVDKLADVSARTGEKLDRLAELSLRTEQKIDRLVEALLRREGQ